MTQLKPTKLLEICLNYILYQVYKNDNFHPKKQKLLQNTLQ